MTQDRRTLIICLDRVHSNLDPPQQDEEREEAGQESEESEGEADTAASAASAAASAARAPKRRSRDFILEYLERKEEREQQRVKEREERDDVHHFLMSLAPAMRRLPLNKQAWLKMKIQELVFQAEFGYSQPEYQLTQLKFILLLPGGCFKLFFSIAFMYS